jgi:hypothetical protein
MAQLELKTAVLNGQAFHLFRQGGEQIPLPDETGWETVWPQMSGFESRSYMPDPDKKILLDLGPGKYWLIESNHNVTSVFSLDVGEVAIKRNEVGGVANGFPEQHDEVGRVACMAPSLVFDLFMQLGELKRQ